MKVAQAVLRSETLNLVNINQYLSEEKYQLRTRSFEEWIMAIYLQPNRMSERENGFNPNTFLRRQLFQGEGKSDLQTAFDQGVMALMPNVLLKENQELEYFRQETEKMKSKAKVYNERKKSAETRENAWRINMENVVRFNMGNPFPNRMSQVVPQPKDKSQKMDLKVLLAGLKNTFLRSDISTIQSTIQSEIQSHASYSMSAQDEVDMEQKLKQLQTKMKQIYTKLSEQKTALSAEAQTAQHLFSAINGAIEDQTVNFEAVLAGLDLDGIVFKEKLNSLLAYYNYDDKDHREISTSLSNAFHRMRDTEKGYMMRTLETLLEDKKQIDTGKLSEPQKTALRAEGQTAKHLFSVITDSFENRQRVNFDVVFTGVVYILDYGKYVKDTIEKDRFARRVHSRFRYAFLVAFLLVVGLAFFTVLPLPVAGLLAVGLIVATGFLERRFSLDMKYVNKRVEKANEWKGALQGYLNYNKTWFVRERCDTALEGKLSAVVSSRKMSGEEVTHVNGRTNAAVARKQAVENPLSPNLKGGPAIRP